MKRATDLRCWLEIKANTLKDERPYKQKITFGQNEKPLYLINKTHTLKGAARLVTRTNSNALRQYKKTITLNQMQKEVNALRAPLLALGVSHGRPPPYRATPAFSIHRATPERKRLWSIRIQI